MSEPALRARAVHVEHRRRAILDVADLTVEDAETLSVVGPNGAGKSTLLRVLGLLETPSRGELWFRGEPVSREPARLLALRRRMAIVFQDPLLCRTTVAANVALGLALRGVPRHERQLRVEEWLERFAIAHLADRPAQRISGGEAQRVSLARAFAIRPEILLLDEPFAALDAPSRQSLVEELHQLLRETHTTTVFVTHDRDEAFALGDRVAVLLGGEVAQIGAADEIARRPLSEPVARFLGTETLLPGRIVSTDDGTVRIAIDSAEITAPAPPDLAGPVWACLRSEDVSIFTDDAAPAPPSWNVLAGTVKAVTTWGTQVRVSVDCGDTVTALTTRLAARGLGLESGKHVRLAFSPLSLHLLPRTERRWVEVISGLVG